MPKLQAAKPGQIWSRIDLRCLLYICPGFYILQSDLHIRVCFLDDCICYMYKEMDESKANTEVLQSTEGIAGIVQAIGQYQIAIGSDVQEVYAAVYKNAGIENGGVFQNLFMHK